MEGMSFSAIMANQRRISSSDQGLISWVCQQLTAFYKRQLWFWTKVRKEFLNKAEIFVISDGEKNYRMALIESDIREVGSFSRTRDGGYCDVCIHRMPENGNVSISGRLTSEQFTEIGKILRVLEMKHREIFEVYKLSELTESQMELCPIWYLPKDFEGKVFVVINGGEKTRGSNMIESTILRLELIKNAVGLALDNNRLSSNCPHTHCIGKNCGYYQYGLARCTEIKRQKTDK